MTTVTVQAGASGAMQEVVFGSSGEPEAHGDGGAGPSPYAYVLMALGA